MSESIGTFRRREPNGKRRFTLLSNLIGRPVGRARLADHNALVASFAVTL